MSRLKIIFLSVTCISGIYSVNPEYVNAESEKAELVDDYSAYMSPDEPVSASDGFKEPVGLLTLREAISAALIRNPKLRAFSWEIRAKEAEVLQSGLLPNPVLETELENFAGTGELKGFNSAETTVQLSQIIPIGGRIGKREKLAELNRELSEWDYETTKLNVLTDVTKAYIAVSAASRRFELTGDLLELAKNVYSTISAKAEAGEISPIEEKRANVALTQARINHNRAERELESARTELAATWGSVDPVFDKVAGVLDSAVDIPSYGQLRDLVSRNPDIERWTTELAERDAAIELEKARAIPDITVRGGTRWLNEIDDQGLIVGLSVPIILFDRNQGDILKARYRKIKAEEQRKQASVRVNSELAVSYRNLLSTFNEVSSLEEEVLPSAKNAYESILEGYRQGKYEFLDVLDSQRTLFDARLQNISALEDYHKSVADIERLTATPMNTILNQPGLDGIDINSDYDESDKAAEPGKKQEE